MADTSTAQIVTETDLIGTLTSNFYAGGTSFTATFIDKKTGNSRAPQSTTLTYTLDQDNAQSETIKAATVVTNSGVTTITIATNGRQIPKYGTGAGNSTGLDHVIGAAVGCVDIALPLNLIAQILNEKMNLDGGQFTGLVDFLEPTGLLRLPNLTTTERNLVTPAEGLIIENITTGTIQIYLGGIWVDLGIGTPTPNASTLVSGKVQMTNQATFDAGTVTGTTGAFNVSDPSIIQLGIQKGAQVSGTLTGSANTYVLTLVPAIAAYTTGMALRLKVNVANTDVSTLNVNGVGAITLKKNITQDLQPNDLFSGQIITVVYDGTNFQIVDGLTSNTFLQNVVNADEQQYGWVTNEVPLSGASYNNIIALSNSGPSDIVRAVGGYGPANGGWIYLYFDCVKIVKLKTVVSFRVSGGSNQNVGFGLAIDAPAIQAAHTAANLSIRFVSDGTNIWSVTGDGVGNTNTLLSGTSTGFTHPQMWEIVWNPANTQVFFYINGILKATHTTNLPTGGLAQVAVNANSTGGTTEGIFTNPILSQQL